MPAPTTRRFLPNHQRTRGMLVALVSLMACTVEDDSDDPVAGTDSGTGGVTSSGSTGGAETGTGGDNGETAGTGGGGGACGTIDTPAGQPFSVVFLDSLDDEGQPAPYLPLTVQDDWDIACPVYTNQDDDPTIATGSGNGLYIYRPEDPSTNDGWPDGLLPLVVFATGNGSDGIYDDAAQEHVYPFLEELARNGFVVVAARGGSAVGHRQALLRCAAEWALETWAEGIRLHQCGVSAVGHSQGGGAAHQLALVDDASLDGLRAIVGIAPAARREGVGFSDPETDPVPSSDAVSYLVLQGREDEDTTFQGITNYDRMAPEDGGQMAASDKVMFLPYDTRHWDFGGRNEADTVLQSGYTQISVDRGRAIASAYITAFLRWKVYGEDAQRPWFVNPIHYQADVSAFVDEIAGAAVLENFWSHLYHDPDYSVLGERPVMLPMFSQGTEGGGSRLSVDVFYRANAPVTCTDPNHLDALPPAELLGGLGETDICIGMSEGDNAQHETHRLRVEWGPVAVGDGINWPMPVDVSQMAYLGLRAGKLQVTGTSTGPLSVGIEVQTEGMTDDGNPLPPATILYDRLITGTPMMHSVRVPMSDFCDIGIDPTQLTSVAILAEELQGGGSSSLNLDSLEFTDHPQDADARCAQESGFWTCQATQTLAAVETACDTVPVSGACPSGQETSTGVTLPQEDFGTGPAPGWIVYTPPGWIADVQNPTQAELDGLSRRCQAACEQEFSGLPHVSANCGDAGALQTPTLMALDATGARQAIVPAYRDGSGIEPAQSLSCGLLDTCASAFDENLAPAVPRRVTYAESQLDRGAEWVAVTGGKVFVLSLDDSTQSDAPLTGSLSWSTCESGNATEPCPFYLASGHVETTQPLVIDLMCNGQWVQRQLDLLELDLVQPAFGIDFVNDEWKGIPPGSMVLATHVEAGPLVFDHVEPNQSPVVLESQDGFIKFHPSGGPKVFFDVWCDGELKPMEAVFSINANWNPHGPPSVTIDMPTSVTCGTVVSLDALVSDPQSDAGPVRWEVDGVLLDASVTTIQVQTAHDIRAIVRDARGATDTDTTTITCS